MKSPMIYLFKSSFNFCTDNYLLCITEKNDVLSVNNLGFATNSEASDLCILRKVMVKELNHERLLLQHLSTLNADHYELLFIVCV